MDIKQGDNSFYIEQNGETVAKITYQYENDTIIIANSTYVDPSLRGQGIARKLLDHLVEHARANKLKIRPLCSYVVAAFDKNGRYDDVKV